MASGNNPWQDQGPKCATNSKVVWWTLHDMDATLRTAGSIAHVVGPCSRFSDILCRRGLGNGDDASATWQSVTRWQTEFLDI